MPGLTNNTNLLAALNQAIVSLNELTTATSNQALNVDVAAPTVNVAAPAVTVEASPIPPAPDVNFDTASIVAELAAIKADILNISGDTDALAGLNNLIDMVTNSGTANGLLGEIRDRLADDGDNIAKAIRESKATVTKTVDLSQRYIGAIPDAKKCKNSIAYVGFLSSELRLAQENTSYRASIAVNAGDVIAEWFKGTIIGTADIFGATEAIATGLYSIANMWQEMTLADFANLVSEFEAVKDAFICDIYEAGSPNEAITNMRETIGLAFTSENVVFQGMDEIILASADMLARVFSDTLTATELAKYTLWTTNDCAACTGATSCGNVLITGTGEPFVSGFIKYNETVRLASEYNASTFEWIVEIQFETPTEVTAIAQTDGGNTIWNYRDCIGSVCYGNAHASVTNASMPFTETCYGMTVVAGAEFYIDVQFALGEMEPGGCSI